MENVNLKKALKAILEYMKEDCYSISFPEFVNYYKGTKQNSDCEFFDYEYVDQRIGFDGDGYYGDMYFPFQDFFIKVNYST